MNPLLQRISVNPKICFGKPCVKDKSEPLFFLDSDLPSVYLFTSPPGTLPAFPRSIQNTKHKPRRVCHRLAK